MKRFIGCCLIVTVIMSCLTIFARENDYVDTKYEIPSKVLNAFNIISFSEDGNIDVGSKISRAEFTVMVAKALAMNLYGNSSSYVYSDIQVGSEIHNAVIFAKELGIISGFEDGTFRPQETITVAQAVSMLSKMIGYKMIAEAKGGYPVGYMQVARETGILSGVTDTSESLTKANAILMLYNAMNAEIMSQINFGTNEKYQVQKGVNIFSQYHKVYKLNGIITDNGRTALDGGTKISKNEIKINDKVFVDKNNMLADYLGYVAEVYYTEDEINEIVFGYVLNSKNETLKIDAEDLVHTGNPLSDGYFTYRDSNDKEAKIIIAKDFDVIYNGRAFPQFTLNDLLIDSGTLLFVDNNKDGESDVLFAEEFKHVIVSGSNKETRKIYSLDNSVISIDDLADYEFITISGETLDISDLTSDMTVSIFESYDKKYVKGIVSSERITGAIDEIIYASPCIIKIKGVNYKVSKALKSINEQSLKIGSQVNIYLDHKGEIAFINDTLSNQSGEYVYGYLINAQAERGLSNKAVFRIFTGKGEFKNYNGAKYVTFNEKTIGSDGKKYTSKSVLESSLITSAGKIKPQLIKYKLNSTNEISEIETAIENISPLGFNNERFSMDYSANAVYRDIPKMFGSSYVINNDTLLFNIPKPKDGEIDEDACMILSLSQFEGNTLYPVTLYDSNASRISSVLVTSYFSAEEYSRWGLLVENITTALNEDGAAVTKVYGYMNGKKISYEFADSKIPNGNIKAGDLLRVMLNVKNQIVDYSHLFDYEKDVFPSKMSSNPGGILVGVYGRVLSKEKGSMTVVVEDNKVYPFVFSTYTRMYYVDRINRNNIRVGLATSDDIIQSGKNYNDLNIFNMVGSKVYINRRYDNAYDIIIVRD